MSIDRYLAEKLRKIEALFAGAATEGERIAAGEAARRIRARLAALIGQEPAVEMRFSIPDPWGQRLFDALCRRYGLTPYRRPRMKQQTLLVKAPRSFLEKTLWPEFQALHAALQEHLLEVTDRVIREEILGGAPDRAGEAGSGSRRPAG